MESEQAMWHATRVSRIFRTEDNVCICWKNEIIYNGTGLIDKYLILYGDSILRPGVGEDALNSQVDDRRLV
jgi:hypothetical protein